MSQPQKPKQKKLTRQQHIVLELLEQGHRLTPMAAMGLGIQRLGARIWDLRKAGYLINDRFVGVRKASTGERVKVKEYWLAVQYLDSEAAGRAGTPTASSDATDSADGHSAASVSNGEKLLIGDCDKPVGYGGN